MPYRRTKNVIARLAAKRERILLAAINLADERGFNALNVRDIAIGAHVAPGTVYTHYADLDELRAAIVATRLHHDLRAMHTTERDPIRAFLYSTRAYLSQYGKTKQLGRLIAAEPVYRVGIVNVWGRQIEVIQHIDQDTAAILANGLYGALNAVLALRQRVDAKTEQVIVSMALRTIGAAIDARVAA